MKKIKTILSLVLAAAVLAFIPGVSSLKAAAAPAVPAVPVPQPVTYVIKYFDDYKDWRYQVSENGAWDDKAVHRELYYMYQTIKEGDALVVEGDGAGKEIKIPVSLSNITYNHGKGAILFVPSVQYVFVLQDSVGIVNGNVAAAYVYDNAVAQFNNDVYYLHLVEANDDTQTVGVAGTVNYVEFGDLERITFRVYSFDPCTFVLKDGVLKTDGTHYSLTPPPVFPAA